MKLSVSVSILCVLLVSLLSETYAKPKPTKHMQNQIRPKRQSDQRMAELETLFALQKMKGIAVPIGFGKVDPAKIGRKRRSGDEGIPLFRMMLPEPEPQDGGLSGF